MMTREEFVAHVNTVHGFTTDVDFVQPDLRPTIGYHTWLHTGDGHDHAMDHEHETLEVDPTYRG